MKVKQNNLPTGTITFFFSDIEGSSTLWDEHPYGMRAALARHDAILRATVGANVRITIKTTVNGITDTAVDLALSTGEVDGQ